MGKGSGYFADYPKHVFLILGNEFCERFSFYGMKAILVLFLKQALGYSENSATSIYHGFNMVCYFTPIFGAMIADGYLGKYKTILIISIVYAIGNCVTAVGAIPFDGQTYIDAIPFTGLVLIAIGTGGIKPCVSAFGADQFEDHQTKQKATFFSMFYMSINLGSLLSTIITPIIRGQVSCFGDSCYMLAFGIPAILMIVAVAFFVIGTRWYRRSPPGENVIGKLFGCIGVALKGKCSCSNQEKRDHWLDYAEPEYSKAFVSDVKAVMRVLFMFMPLPVFWALFDQKGSRWVFQAGQLNGDVGSVVFQPDQLQVLNPALVVIIVPLLESLLFPCLDKINFPNRPLQRLGFGMFLAATAFVIAGVLQMAIDRDLPKAVPNNMARFKVINAAPCSLNITVNGSDSIYFMDFEMDYKSTTGPRELPFGNVTFNIDFNGCPGDNNGQVSQDIYFKQGLFYNVIVFDSGSDAWLQEYVINKTTRTDNGKATLSTVNVLPNSVEVWIDDETFNITSLGQAEDIIVPHATVPIAFRHEGTMVKDSLDAKAGAAYTAVIHYNQHSEEVVTVHEDVSPNRLSIFLLVPQYFVMTVGECFFSVTGLSFAYSQAPSSMKAVLQAAWLLTNAFGNCIVMIVTAVGRLPSQVAEFFLFAVLMYVTVVIFTIMALFYKYAEKDVVVSEPISYSQSDGPTSTEKQLDSTEPHPDGDVTSGTTSTRM